MFMIEKSNLMELITIMCLIYECSDAQELLDNSQLCEIHLPSYIEAGQYDRHAT